MSKHKTTKMSYKKMLVVVGIGVACAVLLHPANQGLITFSAAKDVSLE